MLYTNCKKLFITDLPACSGQGERMGGYLVSKQGGLPRSGLLFFRDSGPSQGGPFFEMQQKRKTRVRRRPAISRSHLAARNRDPKQESRIRRQLGDRIRHWRKARGWSQEEFAD